MLNLSIVTTHITPMEAKDTLLEDKYDDDDALEEYLKRKPACFVVLGAPLSGKSVVAKLIAATWKCILVEAVGCVKVSYSFGRATVPDFQFPGSAGEHRSLEHSIGKGAE